MSILNRVKTWAAETLYYAHLNAEFDNIINNGLDPVNIEDESDNNATMQANADPYPAGSESLATSLQGEVQRLRYLLKLLGGESQWYIDPPGSLHYATRLQRAGFNYSTTTAITIDPGIYYCDGTDKIYNYWSSQLTYTFGSGGSNSDSVDLGVSEWHYLYIDDSAVVTASISATKAVLTNAEFVNNTTAPTWSASKMGWYNGNDRCIFAIYTTTGSGIEKFYHDGGDFVQYDDERGPGIFNPSNTWADQTLIIPGFSVRAFCRFSAFWISADPSPHILMYRVNGSSDGGREILRVYNDTTTITNNSCIIMTDSSQIAEVRFNSAGANSNAYLYTEGWFFPKGM